MPVVQGRCLYSELAQRFFDAMEANGWAKVMSHATDGVIKKTIADVDMFMRFQPITSSGLVTTLGVLENYVRGSNGITATLAKTANGDLGNPSIHTITINTACTATGWFGIDFTDATINERINASVTTGNSTSLVATSVRNALAANLAIAAIYSVAVNANVITLTKLTFGDTTIACVFNEGNINIAGTMTNQQTINYSYANASIVHTAPVDYRFYIYDDFVIIGLTADPAITGAINSVAYLGKPYFYGPLEADHNAAFGAASNMSVAVIRPLKNRTGATTGPTYNAYCALPPTNPGQGNLYYMAPMEIGNTTDGIRGEMQRIFALPNAAIIHGDTITVGNEIYDVYVCGDTASSTFAGTRAVAVFNRIAA